MGRFLAYWPIYEHIKSAAILSPSSFGSFRPLRSSMLVRFCACIASAGRHPSYSSLLYPWISVDDSRRGTRDFSPTLSITSFLPATLKHHACRRSLQIPDALSRQPTPFAVVDTICSASSVRPDRTAYFFFCSFLTILFYFLFCIYHLFILATISVMAYADGNKTL